MSTKRLSAIAFIVSIILLPLAILFTIGAAVSGFTGLNAEFHNRVVEYPVPQELVTLIRYATLLIFAPVSFGVCVLAARNTNKQKRSTAKLAIIICGLMIVWMIFINLVLTPHSGAYINSEGSTTIQSSSDGLQIKRMDF